MEINYAYRFQAFKSSNIPSTPWQQITKTLEQDSEIAKRIKEFSGVYIYYTSTYEGFIWHRYELAQ